MSSPPVTGQCFYRDEDVPDFAIRLPATNSGAGKILDLTIGSFDDISIEQARAKADEYNHTISKGPFSYYDRQLTIGVTHNWACLIREVTVELEIWIE